MPRLEKTAATAIAAAVVAVAATVTSLAASPVPDDAARDAARDAAPRAVASGAASGTASAAASPVRAASPAGSPQRVLFIGRSPELNPRGGVARSYPCRAAVTLRWTCLVREGAAPAIPAGLAADVVVVVLVADDDAQRVARLLDRLPAGAAAAPLVLLAPPTPDGRTARRTADLRRLAASRGGTFVDPVAARWLTDPKGTVPFVRGGQLLAAGRARCTERLADELGGLAGR